MEGEDHYILLIAIRLFQLPLLQTIYIEGNRWNSQTTRSVVAGLQKEPFNDEWMNECDKLQTSRVRSSQQCFSYWQGFTNKEIESNSKAANLCNSFD